MATRRTFLKGAAALGLAPAVAPSIASAQGAGKVVVIGGGYGGATVARTLKALAPRLDVTLVEPNPVYTSCPFSNSVLANLREISQQEFRYEGVKRSGVTVAATSATAVDAATKTVTLADGNRLSYDRLVMSPGIDFNWGALPG
jgi:sulfide dehydrogenase [flavocytochrome c] flavoprotein chain